MKKIIALFLNAAILISLFAQGAAFAQVQEIEIYVAPNGNDLAAGTLDAPLATLQGAVDRVEKVKNDNIGVNVIFRGGEYFTDKTVRMTKIHSGTKKAPITFMAYGDEKPIISGATAINTEDFARVEGEMYKRLPKESRDFVGVVDLKKKGIKSMTQFTAETPISGMNAGSWSGRKSKTGFVATELYDVNVEFYFNDRSMSLAEWPNGSDRWMTIKEAPNNWTAKIDSKGRMKNWANAEYPIIAGYPDSDWSYVEVPVKKFDIENDMVIFEKPGPNEKDYGSTTMGTVGDRLKVGKSLSIQNLIEELDVPGEFYVDYENLKLYFYPPYSTLGIDMRLAAGENVLLKMEDTDYVTFKGITFEKNRKELIEMEDCDYVNFYSCVFRHCALSAVDMINNCKNVNIDGCDFISNGVCSVKINEYMFEQLNLDNDDIVELNPQNVVVNNCVFYDISTQARGYAGIKVGGVGNSITNSLLHECKSGVIYYSGNDHKFNNNEIYNVLKVAKDQGAVYAGRSVVFAGNEIGFNNFHDIDTTSELAGYAICVYNDDSLGSNSIHHNIFRNVEMPFQVSGTPDTLIHSNIIVCNETAGNLGSHGSFGNSFYSSNTNFMQSQLPTVAALDAFDKYKNIFKPFYVEDRASYGSRYDTNLFYGNHIEYPTIGGGWTSLGLGHWDNMFLNDSQSEAIFNNPDNNDYTIKSDCVLPEQYETLKEIKLENIGIYESEYRKDALQKLSDFRLYSPYDYTSQISGSAVFLQWEACHNADEYVVEIALDEDFKKIVGEYRAIFNYAWIDDLDDELTEYFWRVYAVSKSQKNPEKKLNSDGARRFRTQEFGILDKTELIKTYNKAIDTIAKVKEGVEPGNVAYGATDILKFYINESKKFIDTDRAAQTEIDSMVKLLDKEIKNIGNTVYKEYASIENIISQKDSWVKGDGEDMLTYLPDGVKLTNTSSAGMAVYTNTAAPIERNKIFCFRVNINIPDGAGGGKWQAIGFQPKEDAGKILFGTDAGKYGYLFIIKSDIIEVQVWNGKTNEIVGTLQNIIPKGVDTEIRFGVLDFGAGQRLVLDIDGVNVFNYVESENMLYEDLYFSIYDAAKRSGELNCGDFYLKTSQKEIPGADINLGTAESLGDNDVASALREMSGKESIDIVSGAKVSKTIFERTKKIEFEMLPADASGEKGVIFEVSDSEYDENKTDYYQLVFKDNKVILKKNLNGKKQNLAIKTVDNFKINEWNRVKINTRYVGNGEQLLIALNGTELIDYIDEYPINKSGYFGVFNNTSNTLTIRP